MASSLTCLIAVAIVIVSCARPADAQGPEAGDGLTHQRYCTDSHRAADDQRVKSSWLAAGSRAGGAG